VGSIQELDRAGDTFDVKKSRRTFGCSVLPRSKSLPAGLWPRVLTFG
jgi:hypothetical protein